MKRIIGLASVIMFVSIFAVFAIEKVKASVNEEEVLIRIKQKGQKPFTRIVKPLKKIYFFDDWLLEESRRLRRVWSRAEQDHDATRESIGGSVLYDPKLGRYRMYHGVDRKDDNKGQTSLGVSESDDGINWKPIKAPLGLDKYTKDFRNIILTIGQGQGPGGYYLDEYDPNPERRYKASSAAGVIWTSPDGLRWTTLPDRPPWGIWHSDTNNQIWYNPERRTWQICFRPESGDRRVFINESSDLKHWGIPVCAIMAGPDDPVGTEIYGLYVFPFQDIFVGIALYCQFTPNIGSGVVWRIDGTVTPELVYSYDGIGWIRTGWRETVPMGKPGQYGEGMVFPVAAFNDPKDPTKIRIYSRAYIGEHGKTPEPARVPVRTVLWQHKLRTDGWVCLKSTGDMAYLRTRGLQTTSGEMSLNIICRYARVQISDLNGKPYPGFSFEDCEPIMGDHIQAVPKWKGKKNFAELIDEVIKVEIQMFTGELYCINGNWVHYAGDVPVGTLGWNVKYKRPEHHARPQPEKEKERVGPRER